MNRHFPVTVPKSYNSNISKSINRIKSKFEAKAKTKGC